FVNPVLEPAVPKGRELLRTSYMATHTREMLDRALAIFAEVRTPLFPKRVPAHARPAQAAPSLHVRPMVFLPVVDRRSFAHYYSDASPRGLLRVPGFTRLEIGQPVDCGVSFGTEDLIVQSEGRIISKSLKPQLGRPLGIEVELAATESHARDLLNRILNGEAVRLAKRRSWRYHAAAIDAEYSVDGAALVGAVDDISLEGAAVRSQHGFKRGTRVPLRLKPPAGTPIDVAGEVRWCREGEDPAFGVLFCFASPAERYRLGALIGSIQHALSGIAA
ncbi:MAG: PilZ domain-containing protein, partial [Vicinamibacteria bacterium]|nr:PilZ domain-containing protein [Vicinamibacteria bacterium]